MAGRQHLVNTPSARRASAQQQEEETEEEEAAEGSSCKVVSWALHLSLCSFHQEFPTLVAGILAEGAIALSVTLSGGVLFAS